MIKTSYFAADNSRNDKLVSISRITPLWFVEKNPRLSYGEEFQPTASLLSKYKNNEITEQEYEEEYRRETLSLLDPVEMFKKYNDCTFLCYEKSCDFCHRHIVSSWFWEHGLSCEEDSRENVVRIAVVGSRGYSDYQEFSQILDRLISHYKNVIFVSGGAESGADHLLVQYAFERKIKLVEHLPDWTKGKGAGYARNVEIWKDCTFGIAFWDGHSKGTGHSLKISEKKHKKLYIFNYVTKKLYLEKGTRRKTQQTLF